MCSRRLSLSQSYSEKTLTGLRTILKLMLTSAYTRIMRWVHSYNSHECLQSHTSTHTRTHTHIHLHTHVHTHTYKHRFARTSTSVSTLHTSTPTHTHPHPHPHPHPQPDPHLQPHTHAPRYPFLYDGSSLFLIRTISTTGSLIISSK